MTPPQRRRRQPWKTPGDRCCCCVPRCCDLRSGVFVLGVVAVIYASFSFATAVSAAVLGLEPYVVGTQVTLMLVDVYLLATGCLIIHATCNEEKVRQYDEGTLVWTSRAYYMAVGYFFLTFLEMVTSLVFSILAITGDSELQDQLLKEQGNSQTWLAWIVLISSLVGPVVTGYFLWVLWSYREKLQAESMGVVLGLPVCHSQKFAFPAAAQLARIFHQTDQEGGSGDTNSAAQGSTAAGAGNGSPATANPLDAGQVPVAAAPAGRQQGQKDTRQSTQERTPANL